MSWTLRGDSEVTALGCTSVRSWCLGTLRLYEPYASQKRWYTWRATGASSENIGCRSRDKGCVISDQSFLFAPCVHLKTDFSLYLNTDVTWTIRPAHSTRYGIALCISRGVV